MAGKLVVFSGPSGAGKSTIVRHLQGIEEFALEFSISATSRQKRGAEVDGKEYYFLSVDSFKSRIEENDFVEWEEVYPKQYYGTLKSEIFRLTQKGCNIIFDLDVIGGSSLKRMNKENSISIFIKPPSIEVLEERLAERNTETDESRKKRIKKAKFEMTYARRFDHVIINDDLNKAIKEAEDLLRSFLSD